MVTVDSLCIPDVKAIRGARVHDDRGSLREVFRRSVFAGAGQEEEWVQDNLSISRPWVLRGLHFQHPAAQAKLITVVSGAVFDVAVDIRTSSPTYAQWVSVHLSSKEDTQLLIPAGFAHGFQAMSDGAVVLYKLSGEWSPSNERSARWNDPDLGIEWPAPERAVLSDKDASAPLLRELNAASMVPES